MIERRTERGRRREHICTLSDVSAEDGADFLVMECLEGETLATNQRFLVRSVVDSKSDAWLVEHPDPRVPPAPK